MQTKCNQLVGLNGGTSSDPGRYQVTIRYTETNKVSILKRDITFEEATAIQARNPDTPKYNVLIEKYDPSHFEKYWYWYGIGIALTFICLGAKEDL